MPAIRRCTRILCVSPACGVSAKPVEADQELWRNHSHEFMVLAPSGEEASPLRNAVRSQQERAERTTNFEFPNKSGDPEEVATPGARTVEEAAKAVGVETRQIVKSLVYLADGKPVMAIVQGTREINECKLRRVLGCAELVLADDATTAKFAGPVGSIGPVGVKIPVYADKGLKGANYIVTGANKEGSTPNTFRWTAHRHRLGRSRNRHRRRFLPKMRRRALHRTWN